MVMEFIGEQGMKLVEGVEVLEEGCGAVQQSRCWMGAV
jgi:hypothetical protein